MAKGKRTGDVPDDEEVSGATVDNAADSGQVVDGGRGEEMKESSVLGENLDDPGDVDAAAAVDEDASKTRAEAEAATILTKHELSEKVRRSETKYDLMVCFCAYLRMWTETSVVKDFCRVVEADSKAFAAKAFDGVWAEVYGEKSYDDPLTVKEALAESRKIFFGESNPFDLQFPVVVTDENLPRLRRIAQLVGVGLSNGSQDLSGKSLRDKMGLIAELYKKEDGGEDLDQFLGKMNFGIFDRMYGMGGVSKKEIVEFCMALTEKGRANLAILEELQVIFYSTGQDVADINAVDTDFLRQFLALKGAGIDTGNLTPAQFLKAEEKISKENIDMFCEIYGGTGFKIYELEQITQLEDLKLTKNAVKAIHIFKKTGKDFSWQSNVSELNELTDVAVEALELFVDGFFEVYGSSEGKFKALNKLSREQLEFFKSLQKVNLPEAVLFTLIILSEEGKVLPGILTEEEIKVANFVLMEFISVRDLRVDEIVPLIRRIQNSGITLAELSAEIEKIDTPELREAAGKWALKPDSAGLKIVDMILFAYGGRESTLKLHGAGSLIKHAGNIDRIVGALGSRDGAIDALIRELNRPKNKGDFDLNNIVEVGQANCERSTKLVKLFPFCEFHNRIPEFAYKITDEEWQLLSGRAEKLGGLELVTDIGEIEKVIGIILKVDEKVFVEVPLFFAKMGAQLKGLLRAVDFAGECVNGGPKAAQVATLKRLDSYFPNCIVPDDVSEITDLPKVEEVDWEVIRECLEKAPGLAKLGDLSTIGWYLGRSILDKPSFAKIPFFFGRTSGNLPWRARMALSLCNSFTEEEKVASLKKLGEYFPDYEFVDGVTSFDVVAESAWVKLGNRLKTCPEFAKLKDLADIKLFMQMDDASFAELPFFFEKTKFKEGVSEKFKGARALIGRYAGKDADPNELAVLKRLDKHFTFYKFGDAFPSFGEIAEPRWERLEKRLKDHPNLAFAMDLGMY